ncbi:ABC transporter ATP-binding protein [Nitrincola alkalilacustris]|uniref:ABC transporter ATP-binding protein n=1 Tax=Nitrincola alkalilacustris TaxID=1571224 RepID=UPI00124E9553|nr:ABC transporter ATP-binding protein [Nitrincola alkalilacustris]
MSEPAVLLAVTGLSKCYEIYGKPYQRLLGYFFTGYKGKAREFQALESVSFGLRSGETLGVIGRNGSGKSTLLQMISGTLTPTAGNIETKGRVAALLELGAGFNPEFTGRENARLNASIYGLAESEIEQRLDDIIAFSGIGEFIDQPVQHYSSGMFVRLAFSVIAHVDADILIIDEALAVGDALFAQKCMRYLEAFRKQGGAILFVSHDAGAVTRLCERALWLDKGRQMLLGDAKSVTERYLEHLYAEQQDVSMQSVAQSIQADTDTPEVGEALLRSFEEPEAASAVDVMLWHDARQDLLLHSNLRNELQVFRFDPDGSEFGTGKVELSNTCFRDMNNRPLSWLVGGTLVRFEVSFLPKEALSSVIVGFLVKNRLGQVIFGENNCLFHDQSPIDVVQNRPYTAAFTFTMPFLAEGEYVVSVGIASGTQQQHIQHCWRHDALVFSVSPSHIVHGLMGVPVASCEITSSQTAVQVDAGSGEKERA